MDIRIYIAVRINEKNDYITMIYNLCSHIYSWRYLIANWNEWSFSEKRTDRICCKLNKKNKYEKDKETFSR